MIIQLDSLYRDYKSYPYNSSFQITVNGQPPTEKENDVRSTLLTSNYIQYAFYWIGNSSFNNPYSKIKNDTFLTNVIPISGNKCIVIPESDDIKLALDSISYLNGVLLYNEKSNKCSTVLDYDKEFYTVTLEQDIFLEYKSNLLFEDCRHQTHKFENMEPGYFINTSYHEKNNLNLLGVTEVNFQSNDDFVITKGAYRSLVVENVTKNWKRSIQYIRGIFRHVILSDIPSYDSNDFFIVYENPVLKRYVCEKPSFQMGVREYRRMDQNEISSAGLFSDGNITIEIIDTVTMKTKLIHPGNFVETGRTYRLENGNEFLDILVTMTGNGFQATENIIPYTKNSILGVIDKSRSSIKYYTYLDIIGNIVYISSNTYNLAKIDANLPIYLYFIPYEKNFPNLVIPIIPTNNLVCVEAELISLTLPNLPICGYNILLADIPYVLVNFCNAQGNGQEILGNIYSNVPAVVNHNFVCPIANIRNPRLNFVVLTCKQKAVFKMSPRDSLQFRVSLPSGERLSYVSNQFQKVFSCPPLNIPLNKNRVENENLIFPFILNYGISAVFQIRVIGVA